MDTEIRRRVQQHLHLQGVSLRRQWCQAIVDRKPPSVIAAARAAYLEYVQAVGPLCEEQGLERQRGRAR